MAWSTRTAVAMATGLGVAAAGADIMSNRRMRRSTDGWLKTGLTAAAMGAGFGIRGGGMAAPIIGMGLGAGYGYAQTGNAAGAVRGGALGMGMGYTGSAIYRQGRGLYTSRAARAAQSGGAAAAPAAAAAAAAATPSPVRPRGAAWGAPQPVLAKSPRPRGMAWGAAPPVAPAPASPGAAWGAISPPVLGPPSPAAQAPMTLRERIAQMGRRLWTEQ